MPQSPPDLFLSYSSSDRELVREVCRLLEARGVETFLDRKDLVAGLPWPEKLEDGLSRAGAVAVFLGSSGLGGWQRKEMYFALDRQVVEQKEGRDFPVIPVLLPGTDAKTGFLFLNTWVDLRDDPAAPEGMDELARAARGEERERAPGAVAICPYQGLRPFEEEDAPFFCGREAFSERLRDVVLAQPFVAVVGPSGSGKSSVVRAGLLPLLYRQRPPADTWEAATFRPRRRPFYELASALLRLADPDLPFDELDARAARLGDRLLAGETHLEDLVERHLDDSGGSDRLLLVVDQLEELFTLSAEEQRGALVDALLRAAGDSLTVVATLRADFYGQALGVSRELSDVLERGGQINLGSMSPEEVRRAVEEPARRVGFSFQEGLVSRILDDVASEPGRLPLLQFALTELFQQARNREMTHGAYDAFGGVEGAISRRAEHEISRLDAAEQAAAQRLFVTHLVRVAPPEEGAEDTRRPARLADLDAEGRHVVEELSGENALMLVTSRDETSGEEIVEVAHEALIRQWQRLRDWVDEDREFLLWRRRLEVRRMEWEAAGEEPSVLLTGPPLAEAERWLGERGDDLPPGQRDFIAASIARRDQAARAVRRRRTVLFSVTAGAAVVFLLLALLALWGWREARAGERRAWASSVLANATLAAESDPLTGALLLSELENEYAPPGAIHQARLNATFALPLARLPGGRAAAFSPGGDRIVTASDDGTARVWNVDGAGRPVVLDGHDGAIVSIAFSPDGENVLTASEDGTARIWKADGSGKPLVLAGHGAPVTCAVFSADGDRVVSASEDGTARVWMADGTGEPIVLDGHRGAVVSAAFSPDGGRVVTASQDGTAVIWQADGSGEITILKGHRLGASSAMFSPDGHRVLTVPELGTAFIWQVDGADEPVRLPWHGPVQSAAFSPTGDHIVTTYRDGTARVWSPDGSGDPVVLGEPSEGIDFSMVDAAFSPAGDHVVTASADGTARVWKIDGSGEPIVLKGYGGIVSAAYSPSGDHIVTVHRTGTSRVWRAQGAGEPVVFSGHRHVLESAAFSPSGDRIVTAARDDTARVWTTDGSSDPIVLQGHRGPVVSAEFSPDGNRILTASNDGTARIWKADGVGEPVVLEGHEVAVFSAVFSPTGDRVVTASADGTARVWRVDGSGEPIVLEGHDDPLVSAEFNSTGDRVVTASADATARVWAADGSGEPILLEGHDDRLVSAEFSPDGDRVVTASEDASARVWSADGSGESVLLQGHGDTLVRAVFAPGGDRIVTGSHDGTVRVWKADGSGEPIVLRRDAPVLDLAYSPDGDRVVSGDAGGTAQVWQADGSGEPIVLAGHPLYVSSVAFSPDGDRVVTTSSSTALVWRVGWRSLLEYFRSATTACLTQDQRVRYLGESPEEAHERLQECERRHGRLPS